MNSKELNRLEKELPSITRQSRLFKIIKKSVTDWGHWRVKPRGKPRIGYWQNKNKER